MELSGIKPHMHHWGRRAKGEGREHEAVQPPVVALHHLDDIGSRLQGEVGERDNIFVEPRRRQWEGGEDGGEI